MGILSGFQKGADAIANVLKQINFEQREEDRLRNRRLQRRKDEEQDSLYKENMYQEGAKLRGIDQPYSSAGQDTNKQLGWKARDAEMDEEAESGRLDLDEIGEMQEMLDKYPDMSDGQFSRIMDVFRVTHPNVNPEDFEILKKPQMGARTSAEISRIKARTAKTKKETELLGERGKEEKHFINGLKDNERTIEDWEKEFALVERKLDETFERNDIGEERLRQDLRTRESFIRRFLNEQKKGAKKVTPEEADLEDVFNIK